VRPSYTNNNIITIMFSSWMCLKSTPFSAGTFKDMYVTVPEMQVVILPRHAKVSILQRGFTGQKHKKKGIPIAGCGGCL
jgi:hypothetical protein